MNRLLADFGEAAHEAEMAIIYYSGHGIEIDFRNFLIPVDAQIPHVARVAHEAVPLPEALEATFGASKLRLVILDACRDNPFLERMKGLDLGKAVTSRTGLGAPKNPGSAWVFYAATEGQVAMEGPDGGRSPFAASLFERLHERDREIFRVLGKVTEDVRQATNYAQEPKFYGAPPGDEIYLFPKGMAVEQAAKYVAPPPSPSPARFDMRRRAAQARFRAFLPWPAVIAIAVLLVLAALSAYHHFRGPPTGRTTYLLDLRLSDGGSASGYFKFDNDAVVAASGLGVGRCQRWSIGLRYLCGRRRYGQIPSGEIYSFKYKRYCNS